MNEFLSEMFGTREAIGSVADTTDQEKLAEAELLQEALTSEGWTEDQVKEASAETILKVAQALFGDNSALVKAAEAPAPSEKAMCDKCEKSPCKCEEAAKVAAAAPSAPEADEDFQTKMAQADFLGRMMAHSFVQEQSNIVKQAEFEQIKEAKVAEAQANLTKAAQAPAAPVSEVDIEKLANERAIELLKERGITLG